MINHFLSRLPLILLVLLIVLAFWLNQSVRAPSPAQEGDLRRAPDYIVENFSATRMDHEGVTRHVLSAKKMLHYPDDDTADLEQPRLINTHPGKPAMQVEADQAKMSGNGEDIYLTGNVKVLRKAGKGRGETTMTTSFLHLVPDDDIAKTDRPVVITEANAIIKAVGMETSNRTQVTRLLSQVKVVHAKVKRRANAAKIDSD
ncbi:MAG: LPS export ABC transporter periplasmic protein LptC [Nitrosospira sp.]|nr:LPS export ABC transporter periplasmic protein LptC [Nitrosospira sp.]MDN5881394.1 LPS export ABC transporter periplasmic protein LptC [Nitrosospira sp.]MDN5934601.1 LPS export ABC transporter periplasmic protein LptC [Nitrosospira sp.]